MEHTCYLRTRVLGSEDSLESIRADNPTGYGSTLEVGDVCLVWDTFNRVYVFKLNEGEYTEDVPYIVGVSPSLHWELQKCITSDNIRVEQFQIPSIPFGTEYTLTHSKHSRENSISPVVQAYLDGKVSTRDVKVFIVSDTQLKITPTTDDISNITINVITAI